MPTASADGILFNTADGGGLGTALSPENIANVLKLRQVNAFAGGVPLTPQGDPDFSAMTKKLFQVGDFGTGTSLLNLGLHQQGIQGTLAIANGLAPGGSSGVPGASTNPAAAVSTQGIHSDVVAYTRSAAAARGINPDVALAVVGGEGGRGFDPKGNANPGDDNSSFGPLQLHYGNVAQGANSGAGLGDDFTKATGLDARDPSTWKAQIDFGLDHAAKNGWGVFHAAKNLGIGNFTGIGGQPQGTAQSGAPVQVAQNGASDTGGTHPFGPEAANKQSPVSPGAAPGGAPSFAGAPDRIPVGPTTPLRGAIPPVAASPSPAAAAALAGTPSAQVAGPGAPSSLGAAPPDAAAGAPISLTQGVSGSPAGLARAGVDPTLGGLLKGQFVGDPYGFIAQTQSDALKLSAYGSDKAADILKQRATAVENAVARLETPAIKEYQVYLGQHPNNPLSLQDYQAQKAGMAASATAQGKLDVSSSSAAIRAAGQLESAKVTAQQQAQNSPENAAALAAKAGEEAEARESGAALGKLPAQYSQAASGAVSQNSLLDQLQSDADGFRTGKGAPASQAVLSNLSALGHAFGVDTSGIDAKVASYESYAKVAGQVARAAIKDTGSNRAGVQELQFVSGTLPTAETSPAGIGLVTAQMKGLNDAVIAKQQASQAWLSDPSHNNSLRGFEADWNKNVSPSAFVLHRLSVEQPQVFQQTVQQLAQTPRGLSTLQNVRKGLAYGQQQGLF